MVNDAQRFITIDQYLINKPPKVNYCTSTITSGGA